MILDAIAELAPSLAWDDVERAKARLGDDGVRTSRASPVVAALLTAAQHAYERDSAGFFPGVVAGIDALAARRVHAPAFEELRLFRRAAPFGDLESQLAAFRSELVAATHRPSRTDADVLTMTVHQSKGREFDAVVLLDANAASYRWDSDESIRLFYVALTRARKHWEVIGLDGRESPLISALGSP